MTRRQSRPPQDPRHSHYWRSRVKRERRRLERDPGLAECWLCGEPIDMRLPVGHEMGFSLDHVVPLGRGGKISGRALPAHIRCNSSRGGYENRKTHGGRAAWD